MTNSAVPPEIDLNSIEFASIFNRADEWRKSYAIDEHYSDEMCFAVGLFALVVQLGVIAEELRLAREAISPASPIE